MLSKQSDQFHGTFGLGMACPRLACMSITKPMYIGNALANRRWLLAFTSTFLQLFIELSLTKPHVCVLPQCIEIESMSLLNLNYAAYVSLSAGTKIITKF